ncbi:MAG: RDD family protein [Fidelibacterota bacterium]|nr:MAG: RDD family protein [Candidatus Neomarinimicrobiota bacterium]
MNENIQRYAGFWRRFAAVCIDGSVIIFALYYMQAFLLYEMSIIVAITSIPLTWSYFSGMESSPLQATIGKMAVGIYVTDLQGQRISFGRASGRFFGKILSGAILLIGYLLAGFTEKKQSLHDMMAGCLVLLK